MLELKGPLSWLVPASCSKKAWSFVQTSSSLSSCVSRLHFLPCNLRGATAATHFPEPRKQTCEEQIAPSRRSRVQSRRSYKAPHCLEGSPCDLVPKGFPRTRMGFQSWVSIRFPEQKGASDPIWRPYGNTHTVRSTALCCPS